MSRLQVPDLLEEFNIRESRDYRKLDPGLRPIFVSRLYKAFVSSYEDQLRDIYSARGLRLHFTGNATRGNSASNIPSAAFLKKVVFYANRTLITFPFNAVKRIDHPRPDAPPDRADSTSFSPLVFGEVRTRRGAVGGEVEVVGKAHHVDPLDFDEFISLLCRAKPAIEAGAVQVLPIFSVDDVKTVRRYREALLPANFHLSGLQQQFADDPDRGRVLVPEQTAVTGIYLPMFTTISIEMVLGLRRKEAEAYDILQRKLEKLLYEADSAKTESTLLEYLKSVDQGVLELNRAARAALRELWVNETLGAGTSGALLLLTPLVGPAAVVAAKAFAGVVSASEIIKPYKEYRKDMRDVKDSEFYLPWRIFRAQNRWFRSRRR